MKTNKADKRDKEWRIMGWGRGNKREKRDEERRWEMEDGGYEKLFVPHLGRNGEG
jgi:hypothetical protein